MRMITLLLLALALLWPPPAAAARVEEGSFVSEGKTRRYALYVPAGLPAGAGDRLPLVVVFHRSRSAGAAIVAKWRKTADDNGLVIAGPDALDRGYGFDLPGDGPALLRDLFQTLSQRLPLDPRRIYLFGDWDGAAHVQILALLESEYVAAAAGHGGVLQPGNYEWMKVARRKIPFSVQAGNQDVSLRLEVVRGMEERLRGAGFPVEVQVLRGHQNWYDDLAPRINRRAWEFLRQHTLPADPIYNEIQFEVQR